MKRISRRWVMLLTAILFLLPAFTSCNLVTTTDEGSFALEADGLANLTLEAPAGTFEILTDTENPRVEYKIRYNGYFTTKPFIRADASGTQTKIECGAHFMMGSAHYDVKIYVPENAVDVLSVNLASGTLTLPALTLTELSLNVASGTVNGEDMTAGLVDLEVASGKITLAGKFGEIDGDAASGTVEISSSMIPVKAKMELASGAFILRIPDDEKDFTAEYEKLSGSITSEFGDQNESTSGKIVYGKGEGKFSFNILSGSVIIQKLKG